MGASAPAGVPIRLSEMIPREHCEVSLPRLRPKAVFGQGPAGQPRGLGQGAEALVGPLYCSQASTSRSAGLEAGLASGEGTPAPGSAVYAPPTQPCPSGAGELPAPSSLQLERSLQPPRDLGRGLMALLTTDASSLRNPNPFVFLAPILGSLEAPRARSWPEERCKGKGCFSSGRTGWGKFGL